MNRWIDRKVTRDRERGGGDRETRKVVVVVVEWKERKKERNQERKKPRKKERKKEKERERGNRGCGRGVAKKKKTGRG